MDLIVTPTRLPFCPKPHAKLVNSDGSIVPDPLAPDVPSGGAELKGGTVPHKKHQRNDRS